jgi:hypothetical protein
MCKQLRCYPTFPSFESLFFFSLSNHHGWLRHFTTPDAEVRTTTTTTRTLRFFFLARTRWIIFHDVRRRYPDVRSIDRPADADVRIFSDVPAAPPAREIDRYPSAFANDTRDGFRRGKTR